MQNVMRDFWKLMNPDSSLLGIKEYIYKLCVVYSCLVCVLFPHSPFHSYHFGHMGERTVPDLHLSPTSTGECLRQFY